MAASISKNLKEDKRKFANFKVIFLGFLFLILLFAAIVFLSQEKSKKIITNFEECATAGYPVIETYPRQCKMPDGRIFSEVVLPPEQNQPKLSYEINGCDTKQEKNWERVKEQEEKVDIETDGDFLNLTHYLNYVCCAEIKVYLDVAENRQDYTVLKLREKNEGEMCFCICDYKVEAKVGPFEKGNYLVQIFGIEYKDEPAELLWEKEFEIGDGEKKIDLPLPQEEFCGISTKGKCSLSSDCTIGGCSGQVCQSKSEKPVDTTCEWKDCFDAGAYGIGCGCLGGECQWVENPKAL